jgi:hypothetical protein
MKSNVVLIERTSRVGLGMLALASPLLEIPSYPFNLLGLVLVATGMVGYCPVYSLFTVLGRREPPRNAEQRALHAPSNAAH